MLKSITWLGNTHTNIKNLPSDVKNEIGYNLDKIQRGMEPSDWKSMNSVGTGVKEMRIHEENEYRVLYVAKFEETIFVLHAFTKKSEQTSKRDIDLGKQRYKQMLEIRRELK